MSGLLLALLIGGAAPATPTAQAPLPTPSPSPAAAPLPALPTAHPSAAPGPPTPSASPLPPCRTAEIATVDYVSSATAKAGDAFRFKTVSDVPGTATQPFIPKDSVGYAIVVYAHHNGIMGRPGFMQVDARFIGLPDGRHVPAIFFPDQKRMTTILEGSHANAPGYLGIIPFSGYVTGAYNTIHRGREIGIPVGSKYTLVVDDDLEVGKCALTPPSATREQTR
jgi:hypothetical protein